MKQHGVYEGVLNTLIEKFQAAKVCNPGNEPDGIKLHIQYDQQIPHQPFVQTCWEGFDELKKKYFGTNDEKEDNPNVNNALLAKSKIFHYAILSHAIEEENDSTSGISKGIPGMDFIVSLGNWKSGGPTPTGHYNGNDKHQAVNVNA